MVKSGTIRLASDLSKTPVRKSWFKKSTHPTVQYSIHIYPVLLSVPAVSYGMLYKIKNNDNFGIPGLADRLYRASYSTLPATSPAGSGATYRVSSAQGTGTPLPYSFITKLHPFSCTVFSATKLTFLPICNGFTKYIQGLLSMDFARNFQGSFL